VEVVTVPRPASVKGRIRLRACFMKLRTSYDGVDFILDRIRKIATTTAECAID
jgi:hypothetical protein